MKLNSLVFCIVGAALAATSASAQAPGRIKDAGVMSLPLSAYPEKARERGEEGTVEYRVDVDRDGVLRSCEIDKSSGHNVLDQAPCELMIQPVKFGPDGTEAGATRGR